MNVTLCSAFRNATPYFGRYFEQVGELAATLADRDDELFCIWGEGDHSDDTRRVLQAAALVYEADLVTVNHGGPDHGSVVNAERFANLARVWNAIWQRIPQDADAVLFVESDLTWSPATMLALLDDLEHVPAVAPMVLLKREGYPADFWYDTWAFRRNSRNFRHEPPYFDTAPVWSLVMLDSAGSCMAIRGDLARQLTWPAADVIVGVSRQIYEHGGSVWLDPKATVHHL